MTHPRHASVLNLASLMTLAFSSLGAIVPQAAVAEPFLSDRLLMAQQVVEGLPPPPTMPASEQVLPAPLIQPAAEPIPQPEPSAAESRPATIAPAVPVETGSPALEERYLVYVNGDSPLLLDQVRRVESDAFVQDYDGQAVIQAGLFAGERSARQQAAALASQGIGAEVVAVSGAELSASSSVSVAANSTAFSPADSLPLVPVDRQVEFGQTPNYMQPLRDGATTVAQVTPYYVVVPGRRANIPDITDLVTLLGGGLIDDVETSVQELSSPRGPHVRIGPFVDRRAANRWNRYLRDFGLDARVYYQR